MRRCNQPVDQWDGGSPSAQFQQARIVRKTKGANSDARVLPVTAGRSSGASALVSGSALRPCWMSSSSNGIMIGGHLGGTNQGYGKDLGKIFNVFELLTGRQLIIICVIHLDLTISLLGTKFTDLFMPIEGIILKIKGCTVLQKLFETIFLILAANLFDWTVQSGVGANAFPSSKNVRYRPVGDGHVFTSGLPYPAGNGKPWRVIKLGASGSFWKIPDVKLTKSML